PIQSRTVRTSNSNAIAAAWMGQPYANSVTTLVNVSASYLIPYNAVPCFILNVFPQHSHRYRPSFRLWMWILPSPILPLALQSILGQNSCLGFIWSTCVLVDSSIHIEPPFSYFTLF